MEGTGMHHLLPCALSLAPGLTPGAGGPTVLFESGVIPLVPVFRLHEEPQKPVAGRTRSVCTG